MSATASQVTVNASLAYDDDTEELSIDVAALLATLSDAKALKNIQTIGTSEEAIGLGEITTPGWAIFKNLDASNFIELRVATGGAKFAKLKPGEIALLRLGSGAQVPYAISDTASCKLAYIVTLT